MCWEKLMEQWKSKDALLWVLLLFLFPLWLELNTSTDIVNKAVIPLIGPCMFTLEYLGNWCTVCGSHSWVHLLRHSDTSSVPCIHLDYLTGVGRLNPNLPAWKLRCKEVKIKIICLFFFWKERGWSFQYSKGKEMSGLSSRKPPVYPWSQWIWNKWLSRGIQIPN